MPVPRKCLSSGAGSMAAKRIKKEIADLSKENLGAITLTPNESNIFIWKATLPGPAGSPYEGGVFEIAIRIPEDYPFSPPHLQFVTKVYHCNVASTGAICLDLLKSAWSPALSLYKVILSLSSLLTDPNPSDPLVPAIAIEYKRDRKKHDQTAREWVKIYALPKNPPLALVPPPNNRTTFASSSSSRRTISRPVLPASSAPPRPIVGTRRSHAETNGTSSNRAIDIADSDSDTEILGESSTNTQTKARSDRALKRARVNGGSGGSTGRGASSDDVIVIDE